MKDAPLAEQPHADAGTFPLADVRPQLGKQRLDVPPRDVGADRMAEDSFERSPGCAFHEYYSTEYQY